MTLHESGGRSRTIFGVPAVLTASERTRLLEDLADLWSNVYCQPPGSLESDLKLCRRFFDPVARGHTLRERLAELRPAPPELARRLRQFGEPLTIDVGEGGLLVGIEARLLLELLADCDAPEGHVVVSTAAASTAERMAMRLYREWTIARLTQVIDLRAGKGSEVMQAKSVGLVLALLANRSDAPERAVVQWDSTTPDGNAVDHAIHAGAQRFAVAIAGSKRGQSSSEDKLKSGYPLTEARRRLAHRLAVIPDQQIGGSRVFVPGEYRDEVITFLARDLARRASLKRAVLETAFDQLVAEFRSAAQALAYRSMIFERAGDTAELKISLIKMFVQARGD